MKSSTFRFVKRSREWCDTCAKTKFYDEKVAQTTAIHLKKRTKNGLNLYVYRCPLGGGYHLTHQKQ
jgi:hypothetical protein